MGASIGMASGAQKVRGKEFGKKSVSLIGDSTFIHSGITGLIDMVYNGLSSTVIIVDNSTTGMTGHQNHPGTGKNAKGEPAPKIDLTQVVNACGVNSVRIVDPFDLPELRKVIKEELEKDEVSVIIARRPCVLLSSEYVKPAYHTEDCKNCGMCMKLGCPALIKTDKGVVVDETLCTGCGLCTEVCKFNAIKQKAGDK